MAEERTLGLARAHEPVADDLSKEALQRRLEETRDSISHTVTEIKENVANQVQAVKETLDWREQFRKRPVAWSAGAMGVGFIVGYGVTGAIKGAGSGSSEASQLYPSQAHAYAARPILGTPASMQSTPLLDLTSAPAKEEIPSGPGLFERVTSTPAYDRVKGEVASIGDTLLSELSKTAKQLIVPALVTTVKKFIGGYLPTDTAAKSTNASTGSNAVRPQTTESSYQPVRE